MDLKCAIFLSIMNINARVRDSILDLPRPKDARKTVIVSVHVVAQFPKIVALVSNFDDDRRLDSGLIVVALRQAKVLSAC